MKITITLNVDDDARKGIADRLRKGGGKATRDEILAAHSALWSEFLSDVCEEAAVNRCLDEER